MDSPKTPKTEHLDRRAIQSKIQQGGLRVALFLWSSMSIVGTFNGLTIISLPCDTSPGVTAPSSIEWDPQEKVSESDGSFAYQSQVFDWQQSMWAGQVSFPPMARYAADMWSAFILECRGQANAFMMGDPKAVLPKGPALGTPVVSGAGQTGYSLVTRGWAPGVVSILLPGDFIQVGNRLYKILVPANTDANGNSTLTVWPNLRDLPADAVTVQTRACKGLFRLAKNTGNKWSTNAGNYGLSGFAIREAI
jgi:hypothetical protein